jgi:hypothetical protein
MKFLNKILFHLIFFKKNKELIVVQLNKSIIKIISMLNIIVKLYILIKVLL